MSSSVVIKGIRDDEEYKHMLAVYRTCQDANVPVPDAVNDFFGWSEPNGGRSVAVPSTYFKDDSTESWTVDITELHESIKKVVFRILW